MRKDVRILLIGDEGVGKTSLISSLVSEEFEAATPIPRMEEITIPADVTPERCPTQIVNFSSRVQSVNQMQDEITRANVIIIVFDLSKADSKNRVSTYWLPHLREILGNDHKKPIILAGNKEDLVDGAASTKNSDLSAMMHAFSEVVIPHSDCTWATVIHPTLPIYNAEEKSLTPVCKKALSRIFRICDIDNDQLLNDRELNTFQRRCFNAPLQQNALDDVKSMLRNKSGSSVRNNALTLDGFISLHQMFIQRGRHETTWTVLRKFGYDDSLSYHNEYIQMPLFVRHGQSTELSFDGLQFLQYVFDKYDEDRDLHLSTKEINQLFSLAPVKPWTHDVFNMVRTNDFNYISLGGWIAMWQLTSVLNVTQTIEYLAYFGYNYEHDSQLSAIQVSRDRRTDFSRHETSRSVFQCQVIGARGVGKSTLLQGLLGRNHSYTKTIQTFPAYTCAAIMIQGEEKHLILHEIDVEKTDKLTQAELQCDVVCLCYDAGDPNSFDYIAKIYLQHFHVLNVPVLIVMTKAERDEVEQNSEMQPKEFCNKFNLAEPLPFYCVDTVSSNVYSQITAMAQFPHLIPNAYRLPDMKNYVKFACFTVVGALTLFGVYKFIKSRL